MKPLEMPTLFWQFCRLRDEPAPKSAGQRGCAACNSFLLLRANHPSSARLRLRPGTAAGWCTPPSSQPCQASERSRPPKSFSTTTSSSRTSHSHRRQRVRMDESHRHRRGQRRRARAHAGQCRDSGQSPRAPPLPRCRSRSASRRCSLDSRTALSPSGRRRCIHRDATRGGLPQRIEDIGVAAAKQREG